MFVIDAVEKRISAIFRENPQGKRIICLIDDSYESLLIAALVNEYYRRVLSGTVETISIFSNEKDYIENTSSISQYLSTSHIFLEENMSIEEYFKLDEIVLFTGKSIMINYNNYSKNILDTDYEYRNDLKNIHGIIKSNSWKIQSEYPLLDLNLIKYFLSIDPMHKYKNNEMDAYNLENASRMSMT